MRGLAALAFVVFAHIWCSPGEYLFRFLYTCCSAGEMATMRLARLLTVFSFVLYSHCIQFQPREVRAVVREILEEFHDYIHYNGSAVDIPTFDFQDEDLETRQGVSYWYEQIAHKGISAFGPPRYQVYRNVKDYGAKGRPSSHQSSDSN